MAVGVAAVGVVVDEPGEDLTAAGCLVGGAAVLRGEAAELHERLEALMAQASDLARQCGGLAGSGSAGGPGAGPVDPRYLWDVPPSAGDGSGTSS